jgi:lipoprotein NlpI
MAISDFSQSIKINPKLGQAYNNRAIVYFYKGEYDKAWKDVHKAEALGYKPKPKFIEQLKAESGRKK